MTTFKINLTTAEAVQIVTALAFIRRNMAVNTQSMTWQFVSGQSFSLDLGQLVDFEDIICKFDDAIDEAIESHPFTPYINVF